MSKGASNIRVIYPPDFVDQRVADGTSLVWETCSVNRPVPKRVDRLEGAKEYTTETPNFPDIIVCSVLM